MMLLGAGQAVITPPLGTRLSGYGERDQGAERVLDELEARVFWFRDAAAGEQGGSGQADVCLVCADIIGFGQALTAWVRDDFYQAFGLKSDALMLSASHTHSGPQTCENIPGAGGPLVPEYIESLRANLLQAAKTARENLAPVTLHVATGQSSGCAINRRLMVDGVTLMAPNPHGVRDDEVTVISCLDAANQQLRAVLFHYTCHTTTLGSLSISGDYAGRTRAYVESNLKGVSAGFLPGCFGDVRPNCCYLGGKVFRTGEPQDSLEFGKALGAEVVKTALAACEGPALCPALSSRSAELRLPLQAEPATALLTMQRIDFAKDFSLLAMGAEMGVDYGHFVKKLRPGARTVPLGYTNGLVAYVAPEYQFAEGGYESDYFYPGFSLPSPFKPEIEKLIHASIREIMA